MPFSINTNNASMEALASLRATNASLTMAEKQISTGKKVDSAADDPAIYAISQTMNSQVSQLAGVSTGLQVTAQIISTASTQAASSSLLLSTLAQTLAEGQTKGLDATTINQTIAKTLAQIDANANGATFKGVNLLSGTTGNGVTSTTAQSVQDLTGTLFKQAGFNATSAGLGLDGLSVGQSGLQIDVGGTNPAATALNGAGATASSVTVSTTALNTATGSAQDVAKTTTFVLNDGTNSTLTTNASAQAASSFGAGAAVTLGTDGSIATVGAATASGSTVTTSTNDAGNKVWTFATPGAASGTLTQSKDANGNVALTFSTGVDANGNTTSSKTFVSVNVGTTATTSGASLASSLVTAMTNQGFGASKDSATGDIELAGASLYTGTGTGQAAAANIVQTTGVANVITAGSGSQYALAAVNAAISSLTKIASSLGSSSIEVTGLQNTTTTLSDALTSGVGALTDADLSAESAKLTSLQTKQSLAIQSLSIANSQSQSILSLFR